MDGPARNPRTKRFPTVYLGNQPVFAARDVGAVAERFDQLLSLLVHADREANYLLQPCRLDGRPGLYAREIFNRSAYRRKLERLGVSFSGENHARLTPRGTFYSAAWGEFKPAFVLWLDEFDDDPTRVIPKQRGLAATLIGGYRLGNIPPSELGDLVAALKSAPMLSAGDPKALVAHLRHEVV